MYESCVIMFYMFKIKWVYFGSIFKLQKDGGTGCKISALSCNLSFLGGTNCGVASRKGFLRQPSLGGKNCGTISVRHNSNIYVYSYSSFKRVHVHSCTGCTCNHNQCSNCIIRQQSFNILSYHRKHSPMKIVLFTLTGFALVCYKQTT